MKILINEINSLAGIAYENLAIANEFREKANNTGSIAEHTAFIVNGRRHAIVTIVFSAMALEAYINDYAVRKRSSAFFKSHLDNLDFLSKWVVISELFTGKKFPKEKQCFARLDRLKTLRNNLVHPKSKYLEIEDEKQVKELGESAYAIFADAEEAVETISMALKCLIEADETEYGYLSTNISKTAD